MSGLDHSDILLELETARAKARFCSDMIHAATAVYAHLSAWQTTMLMALALNPHFDPSDWEAQDGTLRLKNGKSR